MSNTMVENNGAEFIRADIADAQARAAWEAGRDAAVDVAEETALEEFNTYAPQAHELVEVVAARISALQPPSEFQLPPPPATPTSPSKGPLRGAARVSEAMVARAIAAWWEGSGDRSDEADMRAALEAALNGEG